MRNDIDYERLRKDLMNDFEAAMFCDFPMAIVDLSDVERASHDELIKIAQENGYDLNKYIEKDDTYSYK